VTRSIGKGSVIYSSVLLGAANYQEQCKNGDTWKFEMNQPLAGILKSIIREVLDEKPLKFEAVQMPAHVISSLWVQENKDRTRTYVHLLNASGVRIKQGQKVPNAKSLPAFPPIARDLIFEIDLPSFSKGYVTSPDYAGHQNIKVKKVGENRYRVTVPKEALKAYAVVVFE
jgi:hypothetical protein